MCDKSKWSKTSYEDDTAKTLGVEQKPCEVCGKKVTSIVVTDENGTWSYCGRECFERRRR